MAIETFVFVDIETTGLPHLERNRTKITELAFVAVSRRDLETCSTSTLPLVNKLTYVFNPEKKVMPDAAQITGLSHSRLKNQPTFKKRIESINSFLEQLPKPVSLVAHNGNRFDFKVLKAEYNDAGKDLPNDLLCIDSICGFRKILKDTSTPHSDVKCLIKAKNVSINDLLTDDEDWPELNTSAEEWDEIDRLSESFSKLSSDSDKSPTKIDICLPDKKEKISYKLTEIYKRFYNKYPQESHRAEEDCTTLLHCVMATKEHFLSWADKNCKLMSEITPLVRK